MEKIRRVNIYLIRFLRGEEEENGIEVIFEEIMIEDVLELMKNFILNDLVVLL